LARCIKRKLDVNDYNLVHLKLVLLLHYVAKCGSRGLFTLRLRLVIMTWFLW